MGPRDQLGQVLIPRHVPRQQDEVTGPVFIVNEAYLAAENGLEALLCAYFLELNGTEQVSMVGDRDRRHTHLNGVGHEIGDFAQPIENAVMGVHVEVDKSAHPPKVTQLGTPQKPPPETPESASLLLDRGGSLDSLYAIC